MANRNPLSYASQSVRQVVYVALSVIGLAVGAAQVGYAAVDASQPDWLTVALAVVPFLAAGLGFTAATHVRPSEAGDAPVQSGSADVG